MSKEDTVMIGARDNDELSALNIIQPGAFSGLLYITSEVLCR